MACAAMKEKVTVASYDVAEMAREMAAQYQDARFHQLANLAERCAALAVPPANDNRLGTA
jgi:hypothetical protein